MEFQIIASYEDYRTPKIVKAYTTSFPADERRNDKQFQDLFNHPLVKIFSVLDENQHKGYLVTWQLSHALFVEHFEVFEEYRGHNLGSKILTELHNMYSKIVLESEPPTLNEIAKRRINFYQRNSFAIIDEAYIQPSYGVGKYPLSLYLLANFAPENLTLLKEEIYDTVYN